MIPAPKRSCAFGGEFSFTELRIFTVGQGASFERTLRALLPEVKLENTNREEANVVLTVASVFSGKAEYCAIRILEHHMEIKCADEAGARNADLKPQELPDTLERNIIIHYYRKDNPLCKEKIFGLSIDGYVEDGFSVLNSGYRSTYLDKYVDPERLAGWGYDTDPKVKESNRSGVIGGCCCAWEDHAHFFLTIPPAIFLFGDRLWNSFGGPTLYDEEFEILLTKLLFENSLPEGTNVFKAVGDILPQLQDRGPLYYPNNLYASPNELFEG